MMTTRAQLARWHARTRIVVVAGTPCLLAAAAWAVWPLHAAPQVTPFLAGPVSTPPVAATFDQSGFGAPIYRTVPKPPVAAAPPAPPLRVQLLAINTSGGEPSAILYDQDDDATAIVKHGGTYKRFKVALSGQPPMRIVLSRGTSTVTLLLDAGATR
jgi:hypothetical protein